MPDSPLLFPFAVSRRQQTTRNQARAEERRRAAARRRRLRLGLIGVGTVAVLGALLLLIQPTPPPSGTVDVTAWDLPALDGDGRIALADFRGKPTVAAFFASWCPHCRRELPGFAALSARVGDQVNWVGINTQDNGRGAGIAETSGIEGWPLARDVGGSDGRGLSSAFGARGMPLTVIYGPGGEVVDVNLGVVSARQLEAKLAAFFGVAAEG